MDAFKGTIIHRFDDAEYYPNPTSENSCFFQKPNTQIPLLNVDFTPNSKYIITGSTNNK